jgi:hypothetical protein
MSGTGTEKTEDELADGEHNEWEREDDKCSGGVDVRQQGGGTDGAADHDAAAADHIEGEPVKHVAVNRQSVWLRNGPIEPKTSPSLSEGTVPRDRRNIPGDGTVVY